MEAAAMLATLAAQGLPALLPLAVLEGPVVTIAAGGLAQFGLVPVLPAIAGLVLADLVGDLGLYLLGRRGLARLPGRWRSRLGLTEARQAAVARHFRLHGTRTLVLGKLTHTAGALVLVTAGSVRMPLPVFLWVNLLATLPKTAALFALGWVFGGVLPLTGPALALAGAVLLALFLAAVLPWRWRGGVAE